MVLPKLVTIILIAAVVEIAVIQAQPPSDVSEVILTSQGARSLLTVHLFPKDSDMEDHCTLSRALSDLRLTTDHNVRPLEFLYRWRAELFCPRIMAA